MPALSYHSSDDCVQLQFVKSLTLDALILSFYGVIMDFILGSVLFASMYTKLNIKERTQGTRKLYRYSAYSLYFIWTALLVILIVLTSLVNFVPQVSNTVHIKSIFTLVVNLINTIQFLAAYEFMVAIELLTKIAVGTVRLEEASSQNARSTRDEPMSVSRFSNPEEMHISALGSVIDKGSEKGVEKELSFFSKKSSKEENPSSRRKSSERLNI